MHGENKFKSKSLRNKIYSESLITHKIQTMKYIITALLLFQFLFASAQVDDIKKKSRENKNSGGNSDSYNYGGGNSDNPCLDACGEACFEFAFAIAFEALLSHHAYLMENRDKDPTVLSLDLMPHFAYGPEDNYFNLLPRIRGTWGVLSSDFRFNYLADYKDASADIYKVYEWQVVELNFLPIEELNIRVGSGIFVENFTASSLDPISGSMVGRRYKDTYNENFASLELRLNDQQVLTSLEGRFAYDYDTGNHVFTEINLRASFRFLDIPHVFSYLTGGIVYQKYYSSIDLWSIQAGFSFNIH